MPILNVQYFAVTGSALALLIASALKLLGVILEGGAGWFSAEVLTGIAGIEGMVGVVLLRNRKRPGVIPVCAGAFGVLAFSAAMLLIAGVESCSCLGVLRVPPLAMFAFDVAVMALFMVLWRQLGGGWAKICME